MIFKHVDTLARTGVAVQPFISVSKACYVARNLISFLFKRLSDPQKGRKLGRAAQVHSDTFSRKRLAVGLGSEISPGARLERKQVMFSEERALKEHSLWQ